MTLADNTRLGVYEITSLLGVGGMGEVYRARDTKLGRDVAIKVLSSSFAAHPDRLARFEREARLLATLNHPNIGAIYGVEESSGVIALVLELVEGETLAERIAKRSGLKAQGAGLPVADALNIASQIADALDAAHERGIVHRDLKPANIVITPGGTVKVLDFGLAKGSGGAGEAGGSGQEEQLTHSPTVIGPTIDGVLLGTAPYMSPEQARGKAVDKRTDIWAFGCVFYEMLTGRRAFPGETASDAIAAILEREPSWNALPSDTPAAVRRLLQRCLEKDPKRRLRDIGDLRAEIENDAQEPSRLAAPAFAMSRRSTFLVAATIAVFALLGVAAGALWFRDVPVAHSSTQFTFSATATEAIDPSAPVPSPDGRRIAFVSRSASGQPALWIRRLDATTPQRIAGTDGASGTPFWSPDNRFLGFFADGKLKKVDLSGGAVLNICSMQANLGATWSKDNVIVLAPVNRTVLHRVPAAGGTPEPITTLNADRKENSHRWPHFLPDGRHFLFTARSDIKENNLIYVGSLDSKAVTPLRAAQSNVVYVTPGYLLFAQEGTLMAQRFDARGLSLTGEPFPVAEHVEHTTPSSSAMFGASVDGSVLAYLPGGGRVARLSWFDRTGRRIASIGPDREYSEVRLAPDGAQAAVVVPDADSGNRDIWRLDMAAGTLNRVTSNPANDWQVVWSPDSREIAFASDRNGKSSVYRKMIDGGDEQLVLQSPDLGAFSKDWSPDGRFLLLNADPLGGTSAIWALPLVGDRKPYPLVKTTAPAGEATMSPNGRWMAYASDESGATEIYVKPFEGPSHVQVSAVGGATPMQQPRWRRDGGELFYVALSGDMMSVRFKQSDVPQPAMPVRLFAACTNASSRSQVRAAPSVIYDVGADGTRFLVACLIPDAAPWQVTVSMDWTASLK